MLLHPHKLNTENEWKYNSGLNLHQHESLPMTAALCPCLALHWERNRVKKISNIFKVKRGKTFISPTVAWCCFPVERLPTPLHLTLSSHCDTVTLTVSWHMWTCCILLFMLCVIYMNTTRLLHQQKNTWMPEQLRFASLSVRNGTVMNYSTFGKAGGKWSTVHLMSWWWGWQV